METSDIAREAPKPAVLAADRVVEEMRDGAVFVVDLDGRLASWNEGVGRTLGWTRDEWIGQPLQVVFTPEDVAAGVPEAEMRQASADGFADDTRWMLRKGGERFFAFGSMLRMRDEDGRIVGYLKALRDRTEVKEAEVRQHQHDRDMKHVRTMLQERDLELRALTEGVRDYAIFTLDTEGRISSWHKGAELMKGYTAEEAIGMPFAQLFTPEERARGQPAAEMAIAARNGEYKGEGLRMRKDGTLFEAAVVLTALRRGDGQLLGFLKLTQDITSRRHLERERDEMLRESQAARGEAERSSRSKDEFLASISHELRTPLSAILGWAHVLDRGAFDPETVKHGLGAILRNARLQVQLIEDLLDTNRIESGQLRLDLQRIELGAVIAAAIDSALPTASAKGIGLRTVFGPVGGRVMGDAARLQQVVGNLLSNAIKFTPPGGQISVTLQHSNDQAQIAVSDTGQGIEPEFLERMFERFQQHDASSTRRHGGLGLGLSIVRHLVELHGGTVRAHSLGADQGATFTVTLPTLWPSSETDGPAASAPRATLARSMVPLHEREAPAEAPVDTAVPTRLDGVSVLLVDDEADVRAVTARLLQDAGAHVVAAAGAEEAVTLLRERRPAVVLSDIAMPGIDGYELIRRVRDLPPDEGGRTPAAAFTAYNRPEDLSRALSAGYQMHLAKPVPPTALLAAVAALAQHGPRNGPQEQDGPPR